MKLCCIFFDLSNNRLMVRNANKLRKASFKIVRYSFSNCFKHE